MAHRWLRFSVFSLGALAVGVYIAVSQSNRRADNVYPNQKSRDPFEDNEASRALRDFLAVMNGQGYDAERNYSAALERLRAQGEAVAAEIARIEALLPERDYPSRFALIFAGSELRHPAVLPWLRSVALSRIPSERSSDPHSFSTVAEETILRTTAIDGIGRLSQDNNAPATAALFECLTAPSLSMRRAAVQQLLQTPNVSRDRIAVALPEDQRFLLDLRRIDVREVQQVQNPQKLLISIADQAAAPPNIADDQAAERQGSAQSAYRSVKSSAHNPPPTLNRR